MTASAELGLRKSWQAIADELDERGYALTGPLLSAAECERLVRIYDDKRAFRSRIVMERHNFGRGEYQYFADPLPPLVQRLREKFYPELARIGNRWAGRLHQDCRYP